MIRKCLLITAIVLSLVCVAQANDDDYSVSLELKAQYWSMSAIQRSFFNQRIMMTIVQDHVDMFVQLGFQLGKKLKACEIPMESYEKFEVYVVDYYYDDAFRHVLDHYTKFLESLYGRLPDDTLYKETLAAMKKNFLQGANSSEAKTFSGYTLKEMFQLTREKCSS